MDLLQLKMPADKVELLADALETHLNSGDAHEDAAELTTILTWLRYRLARSNRQPPAASAD